MSNSFITETMEEKTILSNQSKGHKSVDNEAVGIKDYLNLLIREVCISGDSLEKYENLLKKMSPAIYEQCLDFISFFNGVKQKGHREQGELESLHEKGRSLFLTDETICIIDSELNKTEGKPLPPEVDVEDIKSVTNDNLSVGLIIVSFAFPIVGWLLFFSLRKKTPVRAKSCSKAAWIGIIVFFAVLLLF